MSNSLLKIAQKLCQKTTGSQCARPRVSDWRWVDPAQGSVGVDVADLSSGGAAALFPVNAKVYGSCFSSGLECNSRSLGMSAYVEGYGLGIGAGAGWGIPFFGAKGVGKISNGIKRKVAQAVGESTQGKGLEWLTSQAWDGVSGGTAIIAGPDVKGALTLDDFHDAFVTIVGLGANFVVNGVSLGLTLVSKKKPILTFEDVIYTKAIGLMGGAGLATSLDVEASGMVYKISAR